MGLSDANVKRIAVGATVAALAATGAAIYYATRAGDEPPIHVKGGSIYLDIVHNSKYWKNVSDKKHWKLSGGTREKNEYLVYLAPKNPADCKAPFERKGNVVKFTHSDGLTVEFKSTGNHTKVTTSKDLEKHPTDKQRVQYVREGGYVNLVEIDNVVACTFNGTGQLDSVLITEAP